ncbi:hypothetical protein PQX77_019752 [Marasmius sp. AFHP31]|nr:hypothetical protein PQX77_019752 [Marasmius sp. AFHP31]
MAFSPLPSFTHYKSDPSALCYQLNPLDLDHCPMPKSVPIVTRVAWRTFMVDLYGELLEDIHIICGLRDTQRLEEAHPSGHVVDRNVAIVVEVQPLVITTPSRTRLVPFSKVHKHILRSHLARALSFIPKSPPGHTRETSSIFSRSPIQLSLDLASTQSLLPRLAILSLSQPAVTLTFGYQRRSSQRPLFDVGMILLKLRSGREASR